MRFATLLRRKSSPQLSRPSFGQPLCLRGDAYKPRFGKTKSQWRQTIICRNFLSSERPDGRCSQPGTSFSGGQHLVRNRTGKQMYTCLCPGSPGVRPHIMFLLVVIYRQTDFQPRVCGFACSRPRVPVDLPTQ